MAITLNAVATQAKALLRETVSDSITVAQMEEYVRMGYLSWCQELNWPEGQFTQNSVASTQEYTLPDTLNIIFRVYINNQRCVPTTIALMEGDARGIYDPAWRILPAVTVPALGSGANQAIPITQGANLARILYYTRGGNIGFVPKPAAVYPIRVEGAVFAPTPASGDTLVLPDQFKDGLAYEGVYRFLLSDRRADEARLYKNPDAERGAPGGLADEEWQKAMRWRRRMFSGGTDNLPPVIPHDYRGFYGRDLGRPTRVY